MTRVRRGAGPVRALHVPTPCPLTSAFHPLENFCFFLATSPRWDGEQGDLELCRHLMAVVFSVTFLGVIGILEVSLSWHV